MKAYVFAIIALAAGFGLGFLFHKMLTVRRIRKLSLALESAAGGADKKRELICREGPWGLLASQLDLSLSRAEKAALQAQKESAAVREFIADISHQIKTPLAGIISYLDLWAECGNSEISNSEISSALELADRIDRLIRTLLELSRLDSGTVQLNWSELSARNLAINAFSGAKLSLRQKNREVIFNLPDTLFFRGDEKFLTQVFVNIFANALEYSCGEGAIEVSAFVSGKTVFFRISNPCRLSEETVKNMFNRFYRASPDSKGFGLGLAIARSIANLHKGDLRAESSGERVSFILSLPQNDCADSI